MGAFGAVSRYTPIQSVDFGGLIPLHVAVTVPLTGTVVGVAVNVGDLPWSLSAIVTVAVSGELTVYAALAARVAITVSGFSVTPSSMGVTVTTADDIPTGICTLPDNVW